MTSGGRLDSRRELDWDIHDMTLSSLLVTVCLVVPDLLAGKLRSKAGLTRCMGHGAPCITLRICRDTARWTWTTWRTWSMSPPCTFSDQRLCYGQPLAYNKNVWMLDKSWEPGMFWKTWKNWKSENLKTWKLENFDKMKNYHWDMLNNFCFHA